MLQNPSRSISGLLEYARRNQSSESRIHLTMSRSASAENAAQSDEEHELTKQDRVQILWAKALWFATQEAHRRREARIQLRTKQRLNSSRGKLLRSLSRASHGISRAPSMFAGDKERECCFLVLNLVSSTLPCIRQPRPRLRVLDVCGFV